VDNKNTIQESTDIGISIFPSLSGMIFGTLIGSLLVTFTTSTYNMFDLKNIADNFSIIIVNLILGFIAGIVLMRREDVQSFITIEDFWGGILIGFIVAYTGKQFLEGLLNLSSIGSETGQNQTHFLLRTLDFKVSVLFVSYKTK
jgi:hypothetical protein